VPAAERDASGIVEGLVRLAVGLEDETDIRWRTWKEVFRPREEKRPVFLMCPPEYFTVAYIINPWMHGNLRRIDNAVARQQWRALYDVLSDLATVRLVLPQPGSPDMVFTANAGLVKGRHFISRASATRAPVRGAVLRRLVHGPGLRRSRSCRGTCRSRGGRRALRPRGAALWMAWGHRSISARGTWSTGAWVSTS
jgi:ornithine--oxo-acid transaminase